MPKEPGEPNIYETLEPADPQETALEKERQEFLAGLLLPRSKELLAEICPVDARHVPAFLTDLVYSLSPEKLKELREIVGDFNMVEGFRAVKEMLEGLEIAYQKGENQFDVYAHSLTLDSGETVEGFKKGEEANLNLNINFKTYAQIIRFLTGREFQGPDFISDGQDASGLKDNSQLGQYIEQTKQIFDNLIRERFEKFMDIYSRSASRENIMSIENIKDFKESLSWGDQNERDIQKLCLQKMREFHTFRPLSGKRIFELGGDVLARGLGNSGAEAVNFDAEGFDWNQWGMTKATTRITNTMNSENCMALLDQADPNHPDHQFDLTTSRMVFDLGSGIENTVESGKYNDAAIEILKVLAKTTKPGGLSIHQIGFTDGMIFDEDEDKILRGLGFEKVNVVGEKTGRDLRDHPFIVNPRRLSLDSYYTAKTLLDVPPDFEYPTVVLRRI